MKKLFYKLAILLVPIFTISIAIEVAVKSTPNDYSYKKSYLDKNAKDIEVLVLGSSHSFFGVNPEFFLPDSFNGAHAAQSLDYDLFILEKFESKLINLKYVFLPISYFTLFSTLKEIESSRIKNYVIYYGAPSAATSTYRWELLNGEYTDLAKRAYRYFTSDYSEVTCSPLGFGLRYSNKRQRDLIQTGKEAAQRHTVPAIDNLDHNIEVLKRIIDQCQRHNVKLFLFTPPTWTTYRENLNPGQLALMTETIVRLTREHSNVAYYNFLTDPRFEAGDFHDADHLNDRGAKKFTLILNEILLRAENSPTDNQRVMIPAQGGAHPEAHRQEPG